MYGRIKAFLFEVVVSIFYIGYLPKGGGSVASAAAILFYLTINKDPRIYFWNLILLIISGIILGNFSENYFKAKDPGKFVIDDFTGMLVALVLVPPRALFIIAGFLLFRFCDIVKVYPIRKMEALRGGWGIMLDDIAAGLYANLIVQVLRKLTS